MFDKSIQTPIVPKFQVQMNHVLRCIKTTRHRSGIRTNYHNKRNHFFLVVIFGGCLSRNKNQQKTFETENSSKFDKNIVKRATAKLSFASSLQHRITVFQVGHRSLLQRCVVMRTSRMVRTGLNWPELVSTDGTHTNLCLI